MALLLLMVRPTTSPRTTAAAWTTWAGSSGEANNGVASDHTAKFRNVTQAYSEEAPRSAGETANIWVPTGGLVGGRPVQPWSCWGAGRGHSAQRGCLRVDTSSGSWTSPTGCVQ